MTKIGINGFGRIGRAVLKIARQSQDIEVVAINDLGDVENLAYLLRYDSVYGPYGEVVEVKDNSLVVGGDVIKVLQEKDPASLPWDDLGVDVVVESTGVFTDVDKAKAHIEGGGAKFVVISAPTKSEHGVTVVLGVNEKDLQGVQVVSNASCTTNCVAPMMAVLSEAFGVDKALLATTHAYTATQSIVDGPGGKGDFRRGRAGAINLIPSSTGAAIAATKTLPDLVGKFDGIAIRVPVPVVSLSDITAVLSRDVTAQEVNEAFVKASTNPLYRGVIAVTDDEVVSSDFIGDPHSVTIDLQMTRVVGGNLVKILGWYDNEWGYSNRLVEQVGAIMKAA